jgi:hypothetical protein
MAIDYLINVSSFSQFLPIYGGHDTKRRYFWNYYFFKFKMYIVNFYNKIL